MQRIYWTAFCSTDRNAGISVIEHIVNQYGYLVDFKMFSDLAMSMIIEVEAGKVNALYQSLKAQMALKDFDGWDSVSIQECIVLLNVSFSKGTGSLKVDVPEVPG